MQEIAQSFVVKSINIIAETVHWHLTKMNIPAVFAVGLPLIAVAAAVLPAFAAAADPWLLSAGLLPASWSE